MNRRQFLRNTAGASALVLSCPPWAVAAEQPKPSNDEIMAQANDRIRQHRQGAGVIRVRDSAGKPLAGVRLELNQVRHEFLFGCNFFRFGRINEPEREEQYRQRFAALLNFATLGFYWPYYEPERGQPIYDYTEKVLAWTAQQGITCKGHPLAWDFADPKWLPRDFAEIEALSHARVRECVARFKGRLDIWDVVNEPTHLGRFHTRLGEWAIAKGAVPYVAEHLKLARAANPGATLLVNDYRTDPPFAKILDALRQDGKWPFDAIGIQSHMHGGGWPLRQVWEVCDTYQRFGLPIHFTETTIVSGPRNPDTKRWDPTTPAGEARQAEYVPQFYTALFAHPAARALTWWDFSDNGAWQGAAAGLIRADMSPKPVYERLMALIKGQWWTRLQTRTDKDGESAVNAYFGRHRLTATLPDGRQLTREADWKSGQPNRIDVLFGA